MSIRTSRFAATSYGQLVLYNAYFIPVQYESIDYREFDLVSEFQKSSLPLLGDFGVHRDFRQFIQMIMTLVSLGWLARLANMLKDAAELVPQNGCWRIVPVLYPMSGRYRDIFL